MTKRNNPSTSLEAYRNLDPVRLSKMHQDIVRALKAIGEGNYEAIASFLMVKPEKVWKRLNEAEKAGAIFKPGNTVITKNGAKSYTYRATQPGQSNEPITEKAMPGKTISDFSKQIHKIQQTLF